MSCSPTSTRALLRAIAWSRQTGGLAKVPGGLYVAGRVDADGARLDLTSARVLGALCATDSLEVVGGRFSSIAAPGAVVRLRSSVVYGSVAAGTLHAERCSLGGLVVVHGEQVTLQRVRAWGGLWLDVAAGTFDHCAVGGPVLGCERVVVTNEEELPS